MKPPSPERFASFGMTTLIHAAAGLALLLTLAPGKGANGNAGQDRAGLVVVNLASVDHGAAARAPKALVREQHEKTVPIAPPLQRNALSAVGSSRAPNPPSTAKFGLPSASTQQGLAAPDFSGSSAINYRDLLLSHIARFRQYPPEAYRDRLQGSVEVRFILNRDGSIERAWVVSSSGQQSFDREALAALRRAAPMPAIPAELPQTIDISLPIDFEIR